MSNLSTDMDNLKTKYREIFLKSGEEINNQIEKIKPKDACRNCANKCELEQDLLKQEILGKFTADCAFKHPVLIDGEFTKSNCAGCGHIIPPCHV